MMSLAGKPEFEVPDTLPKVRGCLERDAALSKMTWFRTGGTADLLFRPADALDLSDFLRALDHQVPVTVLGVGSNALIRDGGIDGAIIRLGKPFAEIRIDSDMIYVGAGAVDVTLALAAAEAGVAGLEFMRGIPGTVGGAIAMNAGAYGREVADVLVEFTAVDRAGTVHTVNAADVNFAYRKTDIPVDWIITDAVFRGVLDKPKDILQRIADIEAEREASQPLRTRTGGSTFKNPVGDKKAWELIDAAGCRGLRRGGAMVSDKHCNFLINMGPATSADLEQLGEEVRARVKEKFGIELEWEIRRLGRAQKVERD